MVESFVGHAAGFRGHPIGQRTGPGWAEPRVGVGRIVSPSVWRKRSRTSIVCAGARSSAARLGLAEGAGLGPLAPAQLVEAESWAAEEFGGAPLGDARLSRRLVNIVESKAPEPGRAFSGVAQIGTAVKALLPIDRHPDEAAVSLPQILQPHRQRTLRRIRGSAPCCACRTAPIWTIRAWLTGSDRQQPDRRPESGIAPGPWPWPPMDFRWGSCAPSVWRRKIAAREATELGHPDRGKTDLLGFKRCASSEKWRPKCPRRD